MALSLLQMPWTAFAMERTRPSWAATLGIFLEVMGFHSHSLN